MNDQDERRFGVAKLRAINLIKYVIRHRLRASIRFNVQIDGIKLINAQVQINEDYHEDYSAFEATATEAIVNEESAKALKRLAAMEEKLRFSQRQNESGWIRLVLNLDAAKYKNANQGMAFDYKTDLT